MKPNSSNTLNNKTTLLMVAILAIISVALYLFIFNKTATATGGISVSSSVQVKELRDSTQYGNFVLNAFGTPSSDVTISYTTNGQCSIRLGSSGGFAVNGSKNFVAGSDVSTEGYVSAVDDENAEGNHQCPVSFSSASADPSFDGLSGSMTAYIKDFDATNHTITRSARGVEVGNLQEGPEVAQAGKSNYGSFTYYIADQPSAPVTITATTNEQCRFKQIPDSFPKTFDIGSQTYSSTASYTFTRSNEELARTIWNLYAVDDSIVEGDHYCTVSFAVSTAASEYRGISLPSLSFKIIDNDSASSPAATSTGDNNIDKQESEETQASASENAVRIKVGNNELAIQDGELVDAILEGESFTLFGQAAPNTKIVLYVNSTPRQYSLTADKNGYWEQIIDGIEPGVHRVEIETTDPKTGITSAREQLLSFSVLSAVDGATGSSTNSSLHKPWLYVVGFVLLAGMAFLLIVSKGHPVKFATHVLKH